MGEPHQCPKHGFHSSIQCQACLCDATTFVAFCHRCGVDISPGKRNDPDCMNHATTLRAEVEAQRAEIKRMCEERDSAQACITKTTADLADLRARLARVVGALQPFADIHVRAQSHGALEIDVQAVRPGQSVLRICNVEGALEHAHAVLAEGVGRDG